ncbi:PhzF family phenazine biosynthesis protein [Bacillus mycoides]|uniref:PhzF family phenazine biosynthesis protein n=1 Tax=Bacillus mycoides TaxID=1405 RepID=UPI000303F718|nr:PhzF family phenazine biosynthesis protein [Bacillus mycoides]
MSIYNIVLVRAIRKTTAIVVTSLSSKYDYISRYFAPNIGVKEDFVTGSALCRLAPYWNKRFGKKKFHAFQASKRGGELVIEYEDDITYITGKAYTIYKGILS